MVFCITDIINGGVGGGGNLAGSGSHLVGAAPTLVKPV
jgi:hypothetical protein